jgi:peroxiredoxin
MKHFFSLFLLVFFLASCSTGPHYTVKGKIDGSDSIIFYIQKREAGKTTSIDSAISKKGHFTMKKGAVAYPQLVQLVAGTSRKRIAFYLENSEITITGSIDSLFNARVTGSKTQDELNSIIDMNKPLSDKYTKLYQEYQVARRVNNKTLVASLEQRADSIQNEMTVIEKNFVKSHPKSYVTPGILTNLSYSISLEELESMLNGLDTSLAKLPQMVSLNEKLNAMKLVAVGQKAPDFTQNDPAGKPVSLASKVGAKLLLIDFWASWCAPCRQENPAVVKVYNEFHKKGLEIIGVSLDQSKEEWLKAISDDKLTWTHVSDLKYKGNEAAKLYAVSSIPSNFLLDEKGVIIGRNLTGESLEKKVKEVLGN